MRASPIRRAMGSVRASSKKKTQAPWVRYGQRLPTRLMLRGSADKIPRACHSKMNVLQVSFFEVGKAEVEKPRAASTYQCSTAACQFITFRVVELSSALEKAWTALAVGGDIVGIGVNAPADSEKCGIEYAGLPNSKPCSSIRTEADISLPSGAGSNSSLPSRRHLAKSPSINRHLPLCISACGETLHVDLLPAGFIGRVRDPFAIR